MSNEPMITITVDTEAHTATVTATVIAIVELLTKLSRQRRLEVFAEFCQQCGGVQPQDLPRCQCWNEA